MVFTGRDSEVHHALHTQLVPHFRQIVALIDLHLIRHHAGTEALVKSVLKVPARLRLLNELAQGLFLFLGPLGEILDNSPDFQVFYRVASLVF